MSGAAGLLDFLIEIVGLIIIGGLIFIAIGFVSTDERFKQIARFAVGGVLVLAFLYAVKGVLFGGGGGIIQPTALLQFAIGVIVLLVVWYLIVWALKWLATVFPPIVPWIVMIEFVISAVVLIVLLILAANALFGVTLYGIGGSDSRVGYIR